MKNAHRKRSTHNGRIKMRGIGRYSKPLGSPNPPTQGESDGGDLEWVLTPKQRNRCRDAPCSASDMQGGSTCSEYCKKQVSNVLADENRRTKCGIKIEVETHLLPPKQQT